MVGDETKYHELSFTSPDFDYAKDFCENVSSDATNPWNDQLSFLQVVPCIYDLLSTKNQVFANHTKNDFGRVTQNNPNVVVVDNLFFTNHTKN